MSKRKAAKRQGSVMREAARANHVPMSGEIESARPPLGRPAALLAVLALLAALVWSYWPTFARLVATWETEPDYSHGFLVIPLALWFLWVRRERFPGWHGPAWFGLALIGFSILMRTAGSLYYVDAVEDWSLVLWCTGALWLVGGPSLVAWSWPALVFLLFMIPLPFRAERLLSLPLQGAATEISVWILQVLGQPAIPNGHVIDIGGHQLEVAEACSGLRIFMGIMAFAFAYLVLVRSTWWEKLLLAAGVLPVALLANSIRIVATAFLYNYSSSETAERFGHDLAGWLVVPLAAALLGLFVWYLRKLFPEVGLVDIRHLVRRRQFE
jgi:exosortase